MGNNCRFASSASAIAVAVEAEESREMLVVGLGFCAGGHGTVSRVLGL